MSPANDGDDRDTPVGPEGRDALEERVRRALRARAEQVDADTLRVQPTSELDKPGRQRARGGWLMPVAVAAAVVAVVLVGVAVPQLVDDPEPAPTAAASATHTHTDASSAPTPTTPAPPAPPTSPPPTSPPPTQPQVQQVQGPRGLVVSLPSGWVAQPQDTENDACLLPSGTPPTSAPSGTGPTGSAPSTGAPDGTAPPASAPSGTGAPASAPPPTSATGSETTANPPPAGNPAACATGVLISATEQGEPVEDVVTDTCTDVTSTMDGVLTDQRPAAGTTADYHEYTLDCSGEPQHKAVWFLPESQLAIVATGSATANPLTQQIVDSIDLSNYAAIPPPETTASTTAPTGPPTSDQGDVAGREQLHHDQVTELGYTPTTVTVDPGFSISYVVASDAGGRYNVFFFVDDAYVGMDADRPSASVAANLVADLQVQVSYTLSDGSTVPVVFTWDGANLTTDAPLPPAAEESPTGPYR